MADILNLRRFRKARQRADQDDAAARNRATHGRSKAQRHVETTLAQKADRALDGHRREPALDTDAPDD